MEPSPQDVILEEEIDPSYEPTEEELVEYATWLGMDLIKHKNLLWIAKEALVAPLPHDWKPCLTEEDEIYYFNFITGRSIWDHPCDEYYRNVYKEEVEKLNQLQQNNQALVDTSSIQRDPQSSKTVSESTSNPLQMGREGDVQSLQNFSEKLSARGDAVDSKVSPMSSFRKGLSSTSQSNHLTRSLPPPHLEGNSALSNRKGGSFDSLVRSYAANLPQRGCGIPFADFLRMRGRLQLQRADNSVSTCSGHTHMSQEQKMWGQSDDKRELEKKIFGIKDRIEKKLVDEERVVLQQERVEMLERVCKQVQEEESHILDSLRRDIMERMERNIREETKALLAKRRKEIFEEVENAMCAEKLVFKESYGNVLRENRGNEESSQEKRSLENGPKVNASIKGSKGQGPEMLLEAQRVITTKGMNKEQLVLNHRDGAMSLEPRKREEASPHGNHVKIARESEGFANAACVEAQRDGAQSTQRWATKDKKDNDEEDVVVIDSSQKLGPECREERRFEKSFHVQDLRQTSLLLKLEVLMKIGTTNE